MHSYIRTDASHLDTLDGQRVDMKHVMTEPNPKMALVDASWREKNPLEQPKTRLKVGRAQGLVNTNTSLVLLPGKPRSITFIFQVFKVII